MDFSTSGDSPILITIDGTKYPLKRFLLPAFKEWAEEVRKQRRDEILAQVNSSDDRAHLLNFYEPPIQDMGLLVQRARSPEGMTYVLDKCMKAANVPDDARANVLAYGDPMQLMDLSAQLTMSQSVLDRLNAHAPKPDAMGESASSSPPPTSTSSGTSGGSPGTGATTTPGSEAPTTATPTT